MNSATLMIQIIAPVETRYTNDGSMLASAIASFKSAQRTDQQAGSDPQIRITAWKNTAQLLQSSVGVGDTLIASGRIQMSVIERPEGFKEKRAEFVVYSFNKVQPMDAAPVAQPGRQVQNGQPQYQPQNGRLQQQPAPVPQQQQYQPQQQSAPVPQQQQYQPQQQPAPQPQYRQPQPVAQHQQYQPQQPAPQQQYPQPVVAGVQPVEIEEDSIPF